MNDGLLRLRLLGLRLFGLWLLGLRLLGLRLLGLGGGGIDRLLRRRGRGNGLHRRFDRAHGGPHLVPGRQA